MKRKEAIKRFYPAMFPHSMTFSDDDNEALEVLLSTAKKYGDVMGIVKKEVDKLESRESLTGEQYMFLLVLRWFLTLLTEEE